MHLNDITAVEVDGKTYTLEDDREELDKLISLQQFKYKKYFDDAHSSWSWRYIIIVSNLTTTEKKIRLTGYNGSYDMTAEQKNFANNPTITTDENQKVCFCLAPINSQAHTFSEAEIANLKTIDAKVSVDFSNSETSEISANLFYTLADNNPITWDSFDETDQVEVRIEEDGSIRFTNQTDKEIVVVICSALQIPSEISPIYKRSNFFTTENDLLTYRNDQGYETCLFKLAAKS